MRTLVERGLVTWAAPGAGKAAEHCQAPFSPGHILRANDRLLDFQRAKRRTDNGLVHLGRGQGEWQTSTASIDVSVDSSRSWQMP